MMGMILDPQRGLGWLAAGQLQQHTQKHSGGVKGEHGLCLVGEDDAHLPDTAKAAGT